MTVTPSEPVNAASQTRKDHHHHRYVKVHTPGNPGQRPPHTPVLEPVAMMLHWKTLVFTVTRTQFLKLMAPPSKLAAQAAEVPLSKQAAQAAVRKDPQKPGPEVRTQKLKQPGPEARI